MKRSTVSLLLLLPLGLLLVPAAWRPHFAQHLTEAGYTEAEAASLQKEVEFYSNICSPCLAQKARLGLMAVRILRISVCEQFAYRQSRTLARVGVVARGHLDRRVPKSLNRLVGLLGLEPRTKAL